MNKLTPEQKLVVDTVTRHLKGVAKVTKHSAEHEKPTNGWDIAGTIVDVLAEVAGPLIIAAINGEDPLSVLERERVASILPSELKLEVEMLAQRLKYGTTDNPG